MLGGFSSLWWPFGWNWSYLGFLGIIWRTCGSKCGGEGGGIFPTLCVECCLVNPVIFKIIAQGLTATGLYHNQWCPRSVEKEWHNLATANWFLQFVKKCDWEWIIWSYNNFRNYSARHIVIEVHGWIFMTSLHNIYDIKSTNVTPSILTYFGGILSSLLHRLYIITRYPVIINRYPGTWDKISISISYGLCLIKALCAGNRIYHKRSWCSMIVLKGYFFFNTMALPNGLSSIRPPGRKCGLQNGSHFVEVSVF